MAAHRYWRLYQTNYHASSGQAGMRELELRDVAAGTNLAVTPGGATSASQTYSGSAAQAFDGNTATDWSASVFPNWLKIDFGAGNEKDVTRIAIVNYPSTDNVSTRDAQWQWSDNDADWTTLFTVSNPAGAGVTTEYVYTPPAIATADLTAPPATLVAFAGASATVAAPSPSASFLGGASAVVAAPSPSVVVFGGACAALSGPSQTLYAVAHDSTDEYSAHLTAPSPTLSVTTGANSRSCAPVMTLAATGTVTGWGAAELSSPSATLSADGEVSGMVDAALSITTAYRLIGYGGAVCSVSITGKATLLATGTTGGIGGAQMICPLFALTAGATAQNHGGANLLAPSPELGRTVQAWLVAPGAQLAAIGSAVVTATYEAYAINLQHRGTDSPVDEVTRYSNFPFTHVVRYQNSYYGVAADGLYLLEGTTDNGTAIPWAFKTAHTELGTAKEKTIACAYFGGTIGTLATVTLQVGEASYAYNFTAVDADRSKTYRQKMGLGAKARHFAIGAASDGPLQLDQIEFNNNTLLGRL